MQKTESRNGVPPNRAIVPGINWVWYYTDTREDAFAWFAELTGHPIKPGYEWIVCEDHEGRYGFRLRPEHVRCNG